MIVQKLNHCFSEPSIEPRLIHNGTLKVCRT
jgi:hypothetical protein